MQKLTMLGSHLCQDCIYAIAKLKDEFDGMHIEFRNISTDFSALKDFMRLRESEPMFAAPKEANQLGIPFFQLEDGTQTFSLQEFIEKLK